MAHQEHLVVMVHQEHLEEMARQERLVEMALMGNLEHPANEANQALMGNLGHPANQADQALMDWMVNLPLLDEMMLLVLNVNQQQQNDQVHQFHKAGDYADGMYKVCTS